MKVLKPKELIEKRNELEYKALKQAFKSAHVGIDLQPDYSWKALDAEAAELGFQVICRYTPTTIHVTIKKTVYDETTSLDTDELTKQEIIEG